MITASYKYNVEVILILGEENISIQSAFISAIVIDNNYDRNNRPIIYMTLNLQARIYDKMVSHKEDGLVNLKIIKKSSNGSALSKVYIHDNFSYIIKTDPNYHKALKNKIRLSEDQFEDDYARGTISLFKKDTMDNIKRLHCDIIKNSNMASIIHKYTKDRRMIIEPLDTKDKYDTIIIPPMESLTETLRFLNDFDTFYNRTYRYFEDFDVTYILSTTGKPIHGTDQFDTIMIDVLEPIDDRANTPGISIDYDNSTYILYINAQNTSMDVDTTMNIEYESIIGVSSTGKIYKVPLRNGDDKSKKHLIRRVYNDNMHIIDNLKGDLDSTSIVLQVTKTEVDGSLITPNKEYLVNNYDELSEYNGRYILSYKKEIMMRSGEEFMTNIVLGLRKIVE